MRFRSLLICSLPICLVACSKLTVENYDKLTIGMPYEQVVDLLGSPTECSDAMVARSCRWGEGEGKAAIHVSFIGGKTAVFSSEKLK